MATEENVTDDSEMYIVLIPNVLSYSVLQGSCLQQGMAMSFIWPSNGRPN